MKKEQLIFDEKYVGTLTVSHVSKFYGENAEVKALDNVSVQFFTGQFVVILGASGSGKSTLLNLIGGMDTVTEGSINIAGVDITRLSEKMFAEYRREVVGFIFQFYNLMPNLTALENVELAELPGGMHAIDALKLVGLENRKDNFPSELSGGEQQRVSIARAISKNPEIILCDEPTGALDSVTGVAVLKLLLKLSRQHNKTIIIVTHNQNIAKMADIIIKVKNGKIDSVTPQDAPLNADEVEW